MNVSNCIDSVIELKPKSLDAATIEEMELLRSVAALLYKTKSVRKAITMLYSLTNSEYCISHNPIKLVWNNSGLKDDEIIKAFEIERNQNFTTPYSHSSNL